MLARRVKVIILLSNSGKYREPELLRHSEEPALVKKLGYYPIVFLGETTVAFVPGCKHDVFVSYAHVDDEPVPGQTEGWVTSFVRTLNWRLRQLCGRPDDLSIWMDRELARTVNFSDQIIESLHDTAVLLIVLSPGYVSSNWCKKERDTFLAFVKERLDRGSKVFVIERYPVDLDDRPREISYLLGYRFWKAINEQGPQILGHPHPVPNRDQEYYDKLEQVARELDGTLKQLARGKSPNLPTSIETLSCPAVYLAEVTDDLDTLREQVARYLQQADFRILPQKRYSPEATEFQAAATKDLQESVLFVQLLSAVSGKKLTGSVQSFVECQYQLALQANKPILQWRARDLRVNEISDSVHRALIENTTVQSLELEDFKQEIVLLVKAAVAERESDNGQAETTPTQPFVFVNVEHDDLPLANEIGEYLQRHGFIHALPMCEGTAEEIRKDLEDNLLDCDGVIIVYGVITSRWVREQLRQYCKTMYRRQRQLRALAVYEGPPEAKQPISMNVPKMHVIDCRHGLNEEELKNFIEALKAK